jgi:uncharacterized protein YpuA (DUF1002 family)
MIQALAMTDKLEISPAGVTNGATASAAIDTLGADWATIRVALSNIVTTGTASANGVTVSLKESVDSNASNATTFVADQTAIKFGREIRYECDTRTRKRYLILQVAPGTAGVTNEPVSCAAFSTLSRKEQAPASTSAMTGGSNDAVILC